MTRKDFSTALILGTFALFAIRPGADTLCALITTCIFHLITMFAPLALDSKADALRADLAKELAKHSADLDTLKNKIDMLTLGRGAR